MKKVIAIILILILVGVIFMNNEKEKVAVISTKYGDMVVEFYADVAPMHVESFMALAEEILHGHFS